jgi:hypothetical protein
MLWKKEYRRQLSTATATNAEKCNEKCQNTRDYDSSDNDSSVSFDVF